MSSQPFLICQIPIGTKVGLANPFSIGILTLPDSKIGKIISSVSINNVLLTH